MSLKLTLLEFRDKPPSIPLEGGISTLDPPLVRETSSSLSKLGLPAKMANGGSFQPPLFTPSDELSISGVVPRVLFQFKPPNDDLCDTDRLKPEDDGDEDKASRSTFAVDFRLELGDEPENAGIKNCEPGVGDTG